ncbi:Bacteriophage replication gene A protein (GPA) [Gallibacterium anatis]|uniref:Bacteriophage replication gene A protein (GPA) n=1 Tax=Gallibacterium anatis TaxID=750 RepID=A0A377H5N9_9PAST|nr:replication endonuclease [Gallibacterium anatis]KGQ55499.1 replication gene A protein [Gallibacterium anatis DSM 16844 = F 149]STO37814.1 Bacteriophage replication gene A protein (GPA) [Gallibacterium anatis]
MFGCRQQEQAKPSHNEQSPVIADAMPKVTQRSLSAPHLTPAQQEIMLLSPESLNSVEKWIEILPRQQQREHFRKLYLQAYKSVKDDGSIAYKVGNKQRKHANETLREFVEHRLALVLSQYHINLNWLDAKGFAYEYDQAMEEAKQKALQTARQRYEKQLNSRERLTPEQVAEINAEYQNELYELHQQEQADQAKQHAKKEKALRDSRLPFFLLTPKRLDELAALLALKLSDMQYQFIKEQAEKNEAYSNEQKNEIFLALYHRCGEVLENIGLPIQKWEQYRRTGTLKPEQVDRALITISKEDRWKRRLYREHRRQLEHVAIAAGEVQKRIAPYVSNQCFSDWKAAKKSNFDFLKSMALENIDDPDERADLLSMYQRSCSNPQIRRIEMTVQIKGIEEWSEENGLQGYFITLTAPSKYHAKKINGADNKKYNGASPKQTHAYLNRVWTQYRSLLKKHDISLSGVRVAEPHHDATPHWHLLVYFKPYQAEQALTIFKEKAFAEDGDEKGAEKHRFKVMAVETGNPKRSAVGYIMKYLQKNLDGFATDDAISDEANITFKDNAKRANAWASMWGIRQFQFFGVASIGVWRELRKLTKKQENDTIDKGRAIADVGDFASMLQLQGGAGASRKDQQIVLHYIDSDPNEDGLTYRKVVGVQENPKKVVNPEIVYTKTKRWHIVKKTAEEQQISAQSDASAEVQDVIEENDVVTWHELNNGELARPRTCVSNCNRPKIEQKLKNELKQLLGYCTNAHINYLMEGNRLIINRKQYIQLKNERLLMFDLQPNSENDSEQRLREWARSHKNSLNISEEVSF